MFTTYIKSLNDMVFSTSESPEEQPSTGVLGRLGSWLSPWKAKGPASPTENACATSDEVFRPAGDRQSEEGSAARPRRREDPDPPSPPGDGFLCEEQGDATQSGHRHDSAGADPGHTQRQARAGRRLHVYLEETSVDYRGKDAGAGQEVVRTEVTKNLQALPRHKSAPAFDPPGPSAADRGLNVSPADGARSSRGAGAGASLSARSLDSHSEPGPHWEQTGAEAMGRKNAARRRARKNSQGDGGAQEQAQPQPEGFPPSDNTEVTAQVKSPKPRVGESSVDSASSSPATPGGGHQNTSCPAETDKQLDVFPHSDSVGADAAECAVDGDADMADDDAEYGRVERKTETPESKRRSMKMSCSEVKLFKKEVTLNPARSLAGDKRDFGTAAKSGKDGDKPGAHTHTRQYDLKKTDEDPKPAVGRIGDKISLFERQQVAGARKPTVQTQRVNDASPVRKATDRQRAEYESPAQRSRLKENHGAAGSAGGSQRPGDRPMTIKERARNFAETPRAAAKPALPQRPATTGMRQKCTPPVEAAASQAQELDIQGRPDARVQIKSTASAEITPNPDGRDNVSAGTDVSVPKQATVSKTKDNSKPGGQVDIVNSAGSEARAAAGSPETTRTVSPQSSVPSRTGSRSKKKKSREPTSPLSPTGENKPANKPEVTAVKPEQDKEAVANVLASAKVPPSTDNAAGDALEKQADGKPNVLKKETEALGQKKAPDSSSYVKKVIDKPVAGPEGQPEPAVHRDEPDTAAGTKGAIDEDPGISPQKEEKAKGQSPAPKPTRENASEVFFPFPPPPSFPPPPPPTERSVEKVPSVSPVEKSPLDKENPESKSRGKTAQPIEKDQNEEPKQKLAQREEKKVERPGEGTNQQLERRDKGKPQQLRRLEKNTTNSKVSEGLPGISGTEASVAGGEGTTQKAERTVEAECIKDTAKAKERGAELSSAETNPTPRVRQPATTKTPTAKADVCTPTQTNEDDKEPTKAGAATKVLPQSKAKSAEDKVSGRQTVAAADRPAVENAENLPDDSHAHGANGAESSGPEAFTKLTPAAVAVMGEARTRALNDSGALINAHADNKAQSGSSVTLPGGDDGEMGSPVKQPPNGFTSKALSGAQEDGEGKKGSTVKALPSENKWSGDGTEAAAGSSNKAAEERKKASSDKDALKPRIHAKAAESKDELTPTILNGEVPSHPQLQPQGGSEDSSDKPGPETPKAPATSQATEPSPEPKKPSPESGQRPPKKRLHYPRGLSKDDSSGQQDAPSSWLDVDFPKRKLRVPEGKLTYSGSESNLLDTSGELDDEDFVEKIKNLCTPFSYPPRKHNPLRPPQPPFAMPAIKEARVEKTFDPAEFKFGLRKESKFGADTPPSLLAKFQSAEAKSGVKPARASLVDRSMLMGGLDSDLRLREKTALTGEAKEVEAEKKVEDKVKVKSRLEGSCVLSSLSSSSFRGKKSPEDGPQPPPSPTASPPAAEPPQEVQAVVCDSGPPLPSFNDIKLPDYFEKYLHREPTEPAQSETAREKATQKVVEKMPGVEAEKPAPVLPAAGPPSLPVTASGAQTHSGPAERPEAPAPPGRPVNSIRTPKGFHKRPGKMVLFENADFSGQAYEIFRDLADATSLRLSPVIFVKVVRGCWVLYEKPDFQGRTIALEEGGTELADVWPEAASETEARDAPPVRIGSLRLAVWDYSLPHIDLFTEPEGRGRVASYHDDIVETGSFGVPLSTASIQVHSGVWLVFSDPGFQGMLSVVETGAYPFPETWGFPSPFVGSLRPLKMGGFKVENPNDVKAVVYEKPGFEGPSVEIDADVFGFGEGQGDAAGLASVGSLKVVGGFWVGYSLPGFEGQQHILEEGEYVDCSDWGGSEQLLSIRPIHSDFMTPHLKLFSDRDFGKLGVNIDLTGPVIAMDHTGYGVKTASIDVASGIWVVFEEAGFCGEPYVLEKGLYGSPEDWGALQPRVASAMPVVLDDFENAAKFKVELFSEPGFQGSALSLEDSVASLRDGFSVGSCKVIAGSWLAFEGQGFAGRMYVLEVGSYPDLRAMGCVNGSSSILSLQTVGFEFSLPSVTLFERCGLRGKRVVLTDGSVNLPLTGGCSRVQSVMVDGGMWVLYEGINYLGAQILVRPGEILDWRGFSGWQKIGSLRPLAQKQVHFRVRNRHSGLMMSVTGDLDDVKMLRIQEAEETDGLEQIWFYQGGYIHCKLLEECCLCPSGSVTMAGSRVGLTPQLDGPAHLWSVTPDGFVRHGATDLVLEVKGGKHYDKNQLILNSLDASKAQQRWQVEII